MGLSLSSYSSYSTTHCPRYSAFVTSPFIILKSWTITFHIYECPALHWFVNRPIFSSYRLHLACSSVVSRGSTSRIEVKFPGHWSMETGINRSKVLRQFIDKWFAGSSVEPACLHEDASANGFFPSIWLNIVDGRGCSSLTSRPAFSAAMEVRETRNYNCALLRSKPETPERCFLLA